MKLADSKERAVGAARTRGVFAVVLLVTFAQVGPAVARDLFDGNGEDGCPVEFHSPDLFGAPQPTHGSRSDCSCGPTFLQASSEASKPTPRESSDPSAWYALQIIVAPARTAAASKQFIADALRQGGGRIYLETGRLRI